MNSIFLIFKFETHWPSSKGFRSTFTSPLVYNSYVSVLDKGEGVQRRMVFVFNALRERLGTHKVFTKDQCFFILIIINSL